ncbi:MAG: LamG domain-containing protein [Pleurocapsa sp. SU_196_0]|nr:LamG domain-containing protein [Pleurocapsa sp. SU_196_0]
MRVINRNASPTSGAWATLRGDLIASSPAVLWTFEGTGAPEDQIGSNDATGPFVSTANFVFQKSGWGGGLSLEQKPSSSGDGWYTPSGTRIGSGNWSLFVLVKPRIGSSRDMYTQRGIGGEFADSLQFIHNSSGLLIVYQYANASVQMFTSSGAINAGSWYAIGITFDSSTGTLRIFLEGVSIQSETTTSWSPASNTSSIGNDARNLTDGFDGDYQALVLWATRVSDSTMQALVDQVS